MANSDFQATVPDHLKQRLAARRRADWRFRLYGRLSVILAISVLLLLVGSILFEARSAFSRYELELDITPTTADARELHADLLDTLAETLSPDSNDPAVRARLNDIFSVLHVAGLSRRLADHEDDLNTARSVSLPISSEAGRYLDASPSIVHKVALGDEGVSGNNPQLTARQLNRLDIASDAGDTASLAYVFSDDRAYLVLPQADGSARLDPVFDLAVPAKVKQTALVFTVPEAERLVALETALILEVLRANGMVDRRFNADLFRKSDSSQPELAGVFAAFLGTMMIIIVTMVISLPIGIAAAIYLEELAPKSAFTRFITVNITNLAAVPTIVFGLLGAAILINGIRIGIPFTDLEVTLGGGLGRGWPLAGGLVLALMTLPTVIIASRSAIAGVSDTVRQGALALGASRLQMVSHHVLPGALPGMVTGSIIGLAQAIGEAAPLLLLGMFAFMGEPPAGVTDRSTALPVLIYQWSTRAERAFEPLTAAAIVILLLIMLAMNGLAVWIRMKFETKS